MEISVLQLFPNLGQKYQNLFLRPFQHPAEESEREAFETLQRLGQIAHSDVLQARVFSPRADGDLEDLVLDVLEAGVLDPALLQRSGTGLALELAGGTQKCVDPCESAVLFGEGSVVGVVLQIVVLELSPTSCRQVAVEGKRLVQWLYAKKRR
jgi:hypothetical protein